MDEFSKGRFRKKKVYYANVSNELLRDESISLKAKGLYALIESYLSIPDFDLYKSTLKNRCKEGNKAFESAWKELKDSGYLVQYKINGDKGLYYYEYELVEIVDKDDYYPHTHYPHTQKGVCGLRSMSLRGGVYNTINTISINSIVNNKKSNTKTPECESMPSVVASYKAYFGRLPLEQVKHKLNYYLSIGMTYELIERSFDISTSKGKKWPYAEGVLKNWEKENILTVNDLLFKS